MTAAPGPECLTKKEMSVVYDMGGCAHGLQLKSLRDTEKRLVLEGSTRMRPHAEARMKAPWNDGSSWWTTAS